MSYKPNNIGNLGFIPGTTFKDREDLRRRCLHRFNRAAICYDSEGNAESICLSDTRLNKDNGPYLTVTGSGKKDPSTGKFTQDQELIRGNLGLFNSFKRNLPVRVIRGFQMKNGPSSGYRYDGLFMVIGMSTARSIDGFIIFKFELVAC